MKRFIIANWKCNPTTLALAKKLKNIMLMIINLKIKLKFAFKTDEIFCPDKSFTEISDNKDKVLSNYLFFNESAKKIIF